MENREEADSLRNVSYVKQSDTSIMQSRKEIPWGKNKRNILPPSTARDIVQSYF